MEPRAEMRWTSFAPMLKNKGNFSALERCSRFGHSELVQVVYQVRVATPSAQAQNRICRPCQLSVTALPQGLKVLSRRLWKWGNFSGGTVCKGNSRTEQFAGQYQFFLVDETIRSVMSTFRVEGAGTVGRYDSGVPSSGNSTRTTEFS